MKITYYKENSDSYYHFDHRHHHDHDHDHHHHHHDHHHDHIQTMIEFLQPVHSPVRLPLGKMEQVKLVN